MARAGGLFSIKLASSAQQRMLREEVLGAKQPATRTLRAARGLGLQD